MAQEQIQDEIKWLEAQLEAKKHALQEAGEQKEDREVVREIIAEVAKKEPEVLSPLQLESFDAQKKADELAEKDHKHIIEELVEVAVLHGIPRAMRTARALKNPHLMDDFHRQLADHYYEKLKQARKIITD